MLFNSNKDYEMANKLRTGLDTNVISKSKNNFEQHLLIHPFLHY